MFDLKVNIIKHNHCLLQIRNINHLKVVILRNNLKTACHYWYKRHIRRVANVI